jgi:hypothetical protein
VALQLATGIFGIIVLFYMMTSAFHDGERVSIPIWYYPATGALILGITLTFLKGAKSLLKQHLFSNCLVRSLMFGITVYFAVATTITPTRVNRSLEKWEKMKLNQHAEPAQIIPRELDNTEHTAGRPE